MKYNHMKFVEITIHRILNGINRYILHPFDCLVSRNRVDILRRNPPVFIIGAPRSGSTLLTQVLTDAFDISCFSNLHCRFFALPAFAEKFLKKNKVHHQSDYTSEYGLVKGEASPSECGLYWYRFFPKKPAYAPLTAVKKQKMMCWRRSLVSLTKAADRPVLFKNLYVSLRLESIFYYVPEALFIIIKRDEVDNACSLLEGRKRINGNYEQWFSIEPPNIEQLKKRPIAQQVIEQVRHINRQIEQDIKQSEIDADHFLSLTYEELCQDVNGAVNKVDQFFSQHHLSINRQIELPSQFEQRKKYTIPEKLLKEVKSYATIEK